MKNHIKYFGLLLLAITLFSCSDDDSSKSESMTNYIITGKFFGIYPSILNFTSDGIATHLPFQGLPVSHEYSFNGNELIIAGLGSMTIENGQILNHNIANFQNVALNLKAESNQFQGKVFSGLLNYEATNTDNGELNSTIEFDSSGIYFSFECENPTLIPSETSIYPTIVGNVAGRSEEIGGGYRADIFYLNNSNSLVFARYIENLENGEVIFLEGTLQLQ